MRLKFVCLMWFVLLGSMLFGERSAEAYVRTTTKANQQGFPLFWKHFPVPFHISNQNFPANLDKNGILKALQDSFTTWTQPVCTCATFSYKGLTDDTKLGYSQESGVTNRNLVLFQNTNWSHADLAVAVASVIFDRDSGELVAFDIEINTKKFKFTLDGKGGVPGETVIDLANTMTHEAGHTLGIDHSPVATASMFSTAPPGEISKRTLDPDDQKAVCDIYPRPSSGPCFGSGGSNNGGLTDPPQRGCACQQTSPLSIPLFGLAFCLFFGLSLRFRRKS
jgi:hypothetical protein